MQEFDHWHIAYKRIGTQRFEIIQSPYYGWTADPFLIRFKGRLYLFAEIFLYKSERKGVIGFCVYNEEKKQWSDWKVSMDRHWHLSYPYVFIRNEKLYMIPESWQLGEVVLYELKAFPDQWIKVKSLLMNGEYCDSTLFSWGGEDYLISFERGVKTPEGKGILYCHDKTGDFRVCQNISDSLEGARCGGKVIYKNGKVIRVGQNSAKCYGGGLIFYEIDSVRPEYREHEIKRIDMNDFRLSWRRRFRGIHTYNEFEGFKVIDLCERTTSFAERMASKRVRKVFNDKY